MANHQRISKEQVANPVSKLPKTAIADTASRSPIRSPADTMERLTAYPHSLIHADIFQLQRTLGNRALGNMLTRTTQTQPMIQPKLTVNAAGDKYEQEADRVAEQVMRMPTLQQEHLEERNEKSGIMTNREPTHDTCDAFEAGKTFEQQLHTSRGQGQPLPPALREDFEAKFGADFSRVKIHADAQSDKLNRSIQARAFTTGQNIYFGAAQYNPGSDEGKRLMAHELTHVVQQNRGIRRSSEDVTPVDGQLSGDKTLIQRAVGFEFEDGTWASYQVKSGTSFRRHLRSYNPRSWYDNFWGPSGVSGGTDKEEEKDVEKVGGINVFENPNKPNTSANDKVKDYNLEVATKKGNLHSGKGYELQPDGPYSDDTRKELGQGYTDIEYVTDPFEESLKGQRALTETLDDMEKLQTRLDGYAPRNVENGEFVWPSQHQFTNKSIYLSGGVPGGRFKVQATSGIPLEQMADWLETIGTSVPGERNQESINSQQEMQQNVYGSNKKETNASKIMGSAPTLAAQVIEFLLGAKVLKEKEDTAKLKGFLALMLMYIQLLGENRLKEGIKGSISWLARFSFATMFKRLPPTQQNALMIDNGPGTLQKGIAIALRGTHTPDLDAPMMQVQPIKDKDFKTHDELMSALESFSRATWIMAILNGKDLLTPNDLLKYLSDHDRDKTAMKYEKSIRIFQRGHGNATNVKDTGDSDLNVFEHREIDPRAGISVEELKRTSGRAGKEMSFAEARKFVTIYHQAYMVFRNRKN